jgi:hypothetical protein
MAEFPDPKPRGFSTICLPIRTDRYQQVIGSPALFRQWLDEAFRATPELFPAAFAHGYTLKDDRLSAKRGLRLRRIRCKATGDAFSVRPSFVLPYLTAWTDEAAGPLFLRSFGVPFWALARVFGRDAMFWYRAEVGLGRNSIVGTTVRRVPLPEHLLADEHHQPRDGTKNYIATTVGAGCCLGAALAPTAGAGDLQAAYGVFKAEAHNVRADYRPATVNTDGWAATRQAWQALFPLVVILRCFLHGWLNIRARAKLLGDVFRGVGEKVWHAYRASERRSFAQRLRRLGEWARRHVKAAWVLEQVGKLCSRAREYGRAYAQPGGHRTSNMLDRVMRAMNRYFDDGQHLHGSAAASGRHCRAWALLHNFRPWHPAVARANGGHESPAVRLNQHRYHVNWLENLLVSASLAGYRR